MNVTLTKHEITRNNERIFIKYLRSSKSDAQLIKLSNIIKVLVKQLLTHSQYFTNNIIKLNHNRDRKSGFCSGFIFFSG